MKTSNRSRKKKHKVKKAGNQSQQAYQLYQANKFEEAEQKARQGLIDNQNDDLCYAILGFISQHRNKLDNAETFLRKAISLNSGNLSYHYNLALVLKLLGNLEESLSCQLQALAIDASNLSVLNEIGLLHMNLGDKLEAEKYYLHALSLNKNDITTNTNLASHFEKSDQLDEAIHYCEQAIKLDPNQAEAYYTMGLSLIGANFIEKGIECLYSSIHKTDKNKQEKHQSILMPLLYLDKYSYEDIFTEYRNWANNYFDDVETIPLTPIRNPSKLLRIGFISSDFKTHSVSYFLQGIFSQHNKQQFSFYIYSGVDIEDHMTQKLKKDCEHWRNINSVEENTILRQIIEDEIDILIDLSGHSKGNYLPLFAKKPAPIQMTYLGYPFSTGMKTIDYRITDELSDPTGKTENLHTESLLRIDPSFLCYTPVNDEVVIAHEPPYDKNGFISFGSFNNLKKISPLTLKLWANILHEVPNSILILKGSKQAPDLLKQHLIAEFQSHGISLERLRILDRNENTEHHLENYNNVDICLDSFPYNGTTTTLEAIWMGVPVLTLCGSGHSSRVGNSLLTNLSLHDLVADSEQSYVEKAKLLANNIEKIREYRNNLRNILMTSPLTDAVSFTKKFEQCLRGVWESYCNNTKTKNSFSSSDPIQKARAFGEKAFVFHRSEDLDNAEIYANKALSINPNDAVCLNLLGTINHQRGDNKEAVPFFEEAIKIQPNYAQYHYNLGLVKKILYDYETSLISFKNAEVVDPNNTNILNEIASLLIILDRKTQAKVYLDKALSLNNNDLTTLINLSNFYFYSALFGECIAISEQVIKINPEASEPYFNLGKSLLLTNFIPEGINYIRESIRLSGENSVAKYQSILMHMLYSDNYSYHEIAEEHRHFSSMLAKSYHPSVIQKSNRKGPLKIGFISSDFRDHVIPYFLLPIFENHEQKKYEFYCYANSTTQDEISEQLKLFVKHWRIIDERQEEQIIEQIKQDQIDILFDLSGHSSGNFINIFAAKPAPIQISYLGYPFTTGLTTIDYRITDNYADPINTLENLYTERLVRLPNTFLCYQPKKEYAINRVIPAERNNYVTFGSFNNFSKITKTSIAMWSEILKQVDNSKLFLKNTRHIDPLLKDHIVANFKSNGINRDQLIIDDPEVDRDYHMARYNQVDIALDTYPYNGTTTTFEALWMGVPVITLCGEGHPSRVGNSILNNMQLQGLIASTMQNYIDIAVNLANDVEGISNFRNELRPKFLSSPLADTNKFCRNFESIIDQIWQNQTKDSSA